MIENLLMRVARSTDFLDETIRIFSEKDAYQRVSGSLYDDFSPKRWPKGPGVYVVRHKTNMETLYIGVTGQIRGKDGSAFVLGKGGDLALRAGRWTPYCFQRSGKFANHWECGPNFVETGRRPPAQESNYRFHIPLSDIVVDCIILQNFWHEIAPAFIESLLLQNHVRRNKALPLGNQKF